MEKKRNSDFYWWVHLDRFDAYTCLDSFDNDCKDSLAQDTINLKELEFFFQLSKMTQLKKRQFAGFSFFFTFFRKEYFLENKSKI